MASVTDRRGPRSTDRNDSDGNLELRLDEFEILPHRFRQRSLPFLRGRDPVGFGEVRPAFELAVDRFASRQNAHARGEFFDGFPVEPIAHTHWDPIEAPEHIEFRDREAHESVHPHGHPEHPEIEPAAPPRPSRRRSVFASAPLAQIFRGRPFDFRGKRSGADARGEGLRDADDVGQELRSHPRADRCGPGNTIARCPERIDPVVDAEVRALGALEQDALPTPDRRVEPRGGVRDERREARAVLDLLLVDYLEIEAFRPAVRIDEPLLDRDDRLELLSEGDGIDEVAHADPETAHLRAALEPHDDVSAIGKVVDDLPLAFIAKLGSHHYRRGHANRRLNIAARLMVLWMADHATPDGGSRALGRRSSIAAVDLAR